MNSIKVIEKPDNVSWGEICLVLRQAHCGNLEKGIVMKHQHFTGEEIVEFLGKEGHMFIAVLNETIVGTAAFKPKETKFWFGVDNFGYCCMAGVIPQYVGKGIYSILAMEREKYICSIGIDKLYFNTHPQNRRVIDVSLRNGYKLVNYIKSKDYSYVYLVKWLNGCPYSVFRCKYEYMKCKLHSLTRYYIKCAIGKLNKASF